MVEVAYTPEPNTFSSNAGSLLAKSFQVRLLSRPDFRSQPTRMPLQAAVRVRAWRLGGAGEGAARPSLCRGSIEAETPARHQKFDRACGFGSDQIFGVCFQRPQRAVARIASIR